jgi:hypothetical protein
VNGAGWQREPPPRTETLVNGMKTYNTIAAFESALADGSCEVKLTVAVQAGSAYFLGLVTDTSDRIIRVVLT